MDYATLFRMELMDIGTEYESKNEMFKRASNKLLEKGYVKESFQKAINDRENLYPTGLATEVINIAIPHTDTEHINKPFIYVIKPKKPISFLQMGTVNEKINVQNIFILGITDPSKQVGLLSLIIEKIQDVKFVNDFIEINDLGKMETFLKNTFRSDGE